MNTKRLIAPTKSYTLDVPMNVAEDVDEQVVSIWVPGDDTLLQLSSHVRHYGEQVGAHQRLSVRLAQGTFHSLIHTPFSIADCGDVASSTGRDEEGTEWIYVYATWPNLMVFATISHPRALPAQNWAIDAVRSIRCTQEQGG